jgi:O-antigen/teichoic acid export membrane protein
MDKIMIGMLSSESELGYYHNSDNIIGIPIALVTALGTIMLPRISHMLKAEDAEKVDNYYNKSIQFVMFISTAISFGIMGISKEFVPIFFGNGFEKCITLLYFLMPSSIFVSFANVIRTQVLLPRKMDTLYIISLFCGAILNVVINLLLIPRYGSVGAAIGTLLAEFIVWVVQIIGIRKVMNIKKGIINSIPFICTGMIMFLVLYLVEFGEYNHFITMGIKILVGIILYIGIYGAYALLKTKLQICGMHCKKNID